ncbi:MAG TPA: hypothetical protein VJB57_16225 [Dehalococcoidia bacterium]|nr:hypothetical protein [Dehalococcoidia bacterium]
MPRLDLTSLRYIASFASIAVGVGLLLFVALDNNSKPEAAMVISPTPMSAPDVPAATIGQSPTPQPVLPPSGPPLIKGTEADCFAGWRFIDNPQQRWTMCLPRNLLYFDGRDVLPFENAGPQDSQRIYREFAVVNEPWYLAQPAQQTSDVLAPMSLRVDVIGPTTNLDGCPLRQQSPDPTGVVTCKDRLEFSAAGQPAFQTGGSYQRYRALVPTQTGKTVNEVFSLQLTIYSYSANASLQEQLFGHILESLKPY